MLAHRSSSLRRRLSWPFYLVVCVCLFSVLFIANSRISAVPIWHSPTLSTTSLLKAQQDLWAAIAPSLLAAEPRCPPIPHVWGGDLLIGYNADEDVQRPDRLHLSEAQLTELTRTHQAFKAHLQEAQYTLPFIRGSQGIATTAGGVYLPVAVVSITMLRKTGCELPVEVFLATPNEWDPEICDVLLPSLSARCVVLEPIFKPSSASNADIHIDKYQYKITAILFSSFEEVLFLDSDSFPITDPTPLFSYALFKATGMVRWPDFWFASESPYYFDIAGISMPPIQKQRSTESGQLLYHKRRHTDSLLLALYYNFYGPNFYYILQSQGNAGEGDKETFIWSQTVFEEAFYSVKQPIKPLGYMTADGEWRGSAMAQFDPGNDVEFTQISSQELSIPGPPQLPPMFLHVNFPKINPASIFQDRSFGCAGPTKDSDGRMRRIWIEDEQQAIDYFGFDVERRLWGVVQDIACDFEGKFMAWHGINDICLNATTYWNTIFENPGMS